MWVDFLGQLHINDHLLIYLLFINCTGKNVSNCGFVHRLVASENWWYLFVIALPNNICLKCFSTEAVELILWGDGFFWLLVMNFESAMKEIHKKFQILNCNQTAFCFPALIIWKTLTKNSGVFMSVFMLRKSVGFIALAVKVN